MAGNALLVKAARPFGLWCMMDTLRLAPSDLFPPLDPYAEGWLDVGDGHRIRYEVSGNPKGLPVVFVHGGPGAGTQPAFRRFFDPAHWRIILFDQRGCGKSTPLGSLINNTTQALIGDMETLRQSLGVERWLLFGGSWGSTLAIAYGEAYPERVMGFVLRGVFLFRPSEVQWFLHGMGRFFPDAERRFLGFLPEAERADPLHAYYRRLIDANPATHGPAAREWSLYEESCARLIPKGLSVDPDGGACLGLARLESHYMVHDGFLEQDQLLRDLHRIRHLPCVIVQGRYDIICPPVTADELARTWPQSRLVMVPEAGHSSLEPGIRQALVVAVDTLRRLWTKI